MTIVLSISFRNLLYTSNATKKRSSLILNLFSYDADICVPLVLPLDAVVVLYLFIMCQLC